MRDQRRFERVVSRIRCWCEGENVTFYARVANLSEGGLFLKTLTPLEQGARAHLRFQPPVGEEVAATATVVWSRAEEGQGPAGMGLAFEGLDSSTRERIRSLVAVERSSSAYRMTGSAEPGAL